MSAISTLTIIIRIFRDRQLNLSRNTMTLAYSIHYCITLLSNRRRGRCGRDHMVVGFTPIYAINAYHH